jgi:hypothetical protein
VISRNGKPIYVGKALDIRRRFAARFKVLHDFGIPGSVLDCEIVSYLIQPQMMPVCSIASRQASRGAFRVQPPTDGLLRVLEQFFIRHFRSRNPRLSNSTSEKYSFAPGEKLVLTIRHSRPGDPVSGQAIT